MVLNNIIINKTAIINNKINLDLNDQILKKMNTLSELTSKLNTYDSTTNYSKIINLDLYNQISNNKFTLYQPIEYNGWLSLIDFVSQGLSDKGDKDIKVYIDSDIVGSIELIKYIRESSDSFYLSRSCADNIPQKGFEYLKNIYGVQVIKDIDNINDDNDDINTPIKYDLIILTDYLKIKSAHSYLAEGGQILLLTQIKDLKSDLISNLNQNLKIFDQIEIISPTILKSTGEFIIIYKNPTNIYEIKSKSYVGNLMMKIDDFFNYHLHKLIKIAKSKLHILEISNNDLQLKLINVYQTKLRSKIVNYMIIFNIPIKTSVLDFYDTKLLTINNKLYSAINLLSYQFIKYEDIKLEYDNVITNTKYTNLHNLSKNLNRIKRAIDTRYFKKWQYITLQLDNYKSLGEHLLKNYKVLTDTKIKPSNAFMKMYEMLISFNIINKSNPILKSFHFCEAPGMFIIGLNHFLQTKTNIKSWDWYGNSLTIDADKTALTDVYGLIKPNKNRWLIGPESSGDIRDLANIKFFKEKLGEVDLITSDCGICVKTSELNNYEELIAETDYAQFINMLNLLKKGGSGVLKTFIPMELASNVCLIFILTQVFEEVYFSKPITSRPANSEVYLVCIGYLGIDKELLNKLKQLLDKKINPQFNPRLNWIKNIPESFIKQLEDYVIEITRQQMSYLLNIFHFIDNEGELSKIKLLKDDNKLKEVTNQYWCRKFSFESNNGLKLI